MRCGRICAPKFIVDLRFMQSLLLVLDELRYANLPHTNMKGRRVVLAMRVFSFKSSLGWVTGCRVGDLHLRDRSRS